MPIMYACTDHIRQHCQNNFNITLRAAHSHEIVAAYFGYASNIAQNAETAFLLSKIEEAEVMIPDVDLILHRLTRLNNLPEGLPTADEFSVAITDFLVGRDWFVGQVIKQTDFSDYIVEDYLRENISELENELSGAIAETNAMFDEYPEYGEPVIEHTHEAMLVTVRGTMIGSSDPDRPYSGHEIDMAVTVTFHRVAGRTCFMSPYLEAGGSKNLGYFAEEVPAAE